MAEETQKKFEPFVPASKVIPEFTPKAIILGVIFGFIFGAATVYLAIRAGLTVSASIPIAVLAIAVFKRIGNSTILENNIVQTIGSAGESVASGDAVTSPALIFLLGVGYIIGPRIAGVLVAGGVLSYLVLIPLIAFIGDKLPEVLKPGDGLIAQMSPDQIRANYVRYIGAGAVAAAGLITLIRTLPTIISAFRESFKSMKDLKAGVQPIRTERDLPITWVIVGSL